MKNTLAEYPRLLTPGGVMSYQVNPPSTVRIRRVSVNPQPFVRSNILIWIMDGLAATGRSGKDAGRMGSGVGDARGKLVAATVVGVSVLGMSVGIPGREHASAANIVGAASTIRFGSGRGDHRHGPIRQV